VPPARAFPTALTAAAPAAAAAAATTENTTVCGAVTRDDVAAVVIQALLSDKADNKVGGSGVLGSVMVCWGLSERGRFLFFCSGVGCKALLSDKADNKVGSGLLSCTGMFLAPGSGVGQGLEMGDCPACLSPAARPYVGY
jgi:hypothetical protein